MERFAKAAAELLNQALKPVLKTPLLSTDLEMPPDRSLADFAFPCFRLAKEFKKSPADVARQLFSDLQAVSRSGLSKETHLEIRLAGAYINFIAPTQAAL